MAKTLSYDFRQHPEWQSFVIRVTNEHEDLVAWTNGEMVPGRGVIQVRTCEVHPDYRRQGIARRMMEVLHEAKPMSMVIHDSLMTPASVTFAKSLPAEWNTVEA